MARWQQRPTGVVCGRFQTMHLVAPAQQIGYVAASLQRTAPPVRGARRAA